MHQTRSLTGRRPAFPREHAAVTGEAVAIERAAAWAADCSFGRTGLAEAERARCFVAGAATGERTTIGNVRRGLSVAAVAAGCGSARIEAVVRARAAARSRAAALTRRSRRRGRRGRFARAAGERPDRRQCDHDQRAQALQPASHAFNASIMAGARCRAGLPSPPNTRKWRAGAFLALRSCPSLSGGGLPSPPRVTPKRHGGLPSPSTCAQVAGWRARKASERRSLAVGGLGRPRDLGGSGCQG